MNTIETLFVPYELAVKLKELGFDEPCLAWYVSEEYGLAYGKVYQSDLIRDAVVAPTFSQAMIFLYICSNKQIDIELKASDTYEERLRKITKGCEDLRNLQNNKSN